jgi:hypothetical protein
VATVKTPGRPEGGSLQQKVINDNRKPIMVNPEYTPLSVRYKPLTPDIKKFRCCMCGNEWTTQKGNFLSGGKSPLWKGNGGYLPFCKSCCESLMENMTSFYGGNEEHALRHLCHIFDWYYDEGASAMTLTQVHQGNSRVNLYPSKACTRQIATRGETYLDTVRDDFEAAKVVKSSEGIVETADEDDDFIVTRDMIRAWGAGFTKEQYRYLEEEYADWIAKNVCNTKSQEEIYRNIVLAQLDIRTARERGGKVSDAQKALQDLMNSANVLPKQTADNIIADTQTFGTLLKKFEETDPIPEPDERWKDVDGIRKYMNTWFRGGLAKALKVGAVDNVRLYDEAVEEMEKYTVHPDREHTDAPTPDSSIFESTVESNDDGKEN